MDISRYCNKLIHSVSYWLSYQDRIGRQFMIEESSLKYPVADFLSGIGIAMNEIELEHSHPVLKRRRIDLVALEPESREIEIALEFKIAKLETKYESEKKRIFNDLMRLYLACESRGSAAYMMIAGEFEEFIHSFRSIPDHEPSGNINRLPDPKGYYTEWFAFNPNGTKTFPIENSSIQEYSSIYRAFLADFEPRDGLALQLPQQIKTTCMAISPLSRDFTLPYVGGIWKIE